MREEEGQKQVTCVICHTHTHIRAGHQQMHAKCSTLFQADRWEVSRRRHCLCGIYILQPPSRGCGALNTLVIAARSAVNAPETKNGKDFMNTFPYWLCVETITF